MIKTYAVDQKHKFDLTLVQDCSDAEKLQLEDTFNIPPALLEYVDDKDEPARIEIGTDSEYVLMVFWAPMKETSHSEPVSVIFYDEKLFLFTSSEMAFVNHTIDSLWNHAYDKRVAFILDLILPIVRKYIGRASRLEYRADQIQGDLSIRSRMKHLDDLTLVNQDAIYLRSAIQENSSSFAEIKSISQDTDVPFDKKCYRKLHNIQLEINQASRMISLISESVEQLSNTYDRLINNNLNDIMRFLTVWSLLLAVPPIVSGFYGMNMHLPLAKGSLAWLASLVLTGILMLGLLIYLHNHHSV
ncbi:magnesium transporter CorA family protein [Pediococcus cellicola]|uniref:Cora family magnesium transporter n=1 Tax=Pediococcus cellicola TaxID=319652 RepID=A0A0R2IQ01_9LACO|nr:magnesium transporter CorA family protein [Pediococcus cellicola]KRN67267.1 cora family magnesium transporter [Pediococcus cellicola]GEL14911.1 Mg2+ and Co2+ transporter [Pediococcus cellicola]